MEDVSRRRIFTFSQFSFVFICFPSKQRSSVCMRCFIFLGFSLADFIDCTSYIVNTYFILKASWVQIYSNQGETEYISASNTKKYWSWWWNPPFLVTQFILSWLSPFHHYHFMLYLSLRDSWGFSNVSYNIFDNALLIVFRMAKWNRSGNGLLEDFKQLL